MATQFTRLVVASTTVGWAEAGMVNWKGGVDLLTACKTIAPSTLAVRAQVNAVVNTKILCNMLLETLRCSSTEEKQRSNIRYYTAASTRKFLGGAWVWTGGKKLTRIRRNGRVPGFPCSLPQISKMVERCGRGGGWV